MAAPGTHSLPAVGGVSLGQPGTTPPAPPDAALPPTPPTPLAAAAPPLPALAPPLAEAPPLPPAPGESLLVEPHATRERVAPITHQVWSRFMVVPRS